MSAKPAAIRSTDAPLGVLQAGLLDSKAQLNVLLDKISPEHYTKSYEGGSSIGSHMRHIIEFMQALENPESGVDYDSRSRNSDIENVPHVAQKTLEDITALITHKINVLGTDYSLYMTEKLSLKCAGQPILSTLGREVAYVIQHAVHHVFIIKTLAKAHGIKLSDDIGVAPATLEYNKKQCAR